MDTYRIHYRKEGKVEDIWCSYLSLELYIDTIKKNNCEIISVEKKLDNKSLRYELRKYYESKLSYLYYRVKKYSISKSISNKYTKELKKIIKEANNLDEARKFEDTDIFMTVKGYSKKGDSK